MRSGQTYEVFVEGKPVGLVGSTIRTLEERRKDGYTKRFGPAVELRLVREIPRHESEDDVSYNFHLKAAEALDIARKKTYMEDGGLNKISPLIQATGKTMLERERGRIGGLVSGPIQGKKNVESGHLARISVSGGRAQGNKNVKNGHLASVAAKGRIAQIKSGQLARIASEGRRIQAKNGHLASMRCKHWRIDQGKPCICGKHLTVLRKTAVV